MPNNLKIYIIAGESSGDFIGSKLMSALRKQHKNVSFYGVGGFLMQQEGLKSLFDISNIAIMGFAEIIGKIFKIKKLIKFTIQDINSIQPDILITIDSLGFNKRVAKGVKKQKSIKLVHYVAPTVWAWKPKRAGEIAKIYNYLLCLFYFEPKYFEKEGLKTFFVGHPIMESGADSGNSSLIQKNYCVDLTTDNCILLMPGSRITEISMLLPIFISSLHDIRKRLNKNFYAIIPTVPHLYKFISNYIKENKVDNVIITKDVEEKYSAFKIAKLAIVASGTATLELSLANIPCIVAYKVNLLSYLIAKSLIKIKYASIINIIANKEIIKEFLQYDCTSKNITDYAIGILESSNYINNNEIKNIIHKLGFNNFIPSEKAASVILDILKLKC